MSLKADEILFSKPVTSTKELETLYNKNVIDIIEHLRKFHHNHLHQSTKCYVVGNGLSRKNLDIYEITRKSPNSNYKKKSFVIGCNYIYKEFKPDAIVAQDTKVLFNMAKEEIEIPIVAPLLKYNWAMHNSEKKIKNFYPVRFPNYQMTRWNSGDIGLYLACLLGFKIIEYIGFDGGGSSMYRADDGVSFVKNINTAKRVKSLKNSFTGVSINRYEDKLKSPSL